MREIKFRGNSLETKEQVFGHLFYFDDGRCFISPKGTIVEGDKGQHPDEYYLRGLTCIEVEPESIDQYTGLKDKNGVEIYEGDIVKWFSRFGVEIGKIEFARYGFHVVLESTYMYRIDEFQCEVIGNIYENPELLEGA